MTGPRPRPRALRRDPGTREVVGGLVNDECASAVATTTVRLARELAAQVRFVQVIPEGTTPARRAELEDGVLAAALDALRGQPRVRVTFEYPCGDPGRLLVDRSRGALALVVGEDHVNKSDVMGHVADYCRAMAGCHVHVVADESPAGTLVPARAPRRAKGLEHKEKGRS
ncbi:hypothetical protein [Intrasporangium mesophilum]